MYVYSRENIKRFSVENFGSGEFANNVGPTEEDILRAIANAYQEITTANDVQVGDVLFLQKGYAEVQKVYQSKEGSDKYGVTIGVVYLTGEHQGEEEIKQLDLGERLTVMKGVREYKKQAKAQGAQDAEIGVREEAVKDIQAKNIRRGMKLALSKGIGEVTSVEHLENDDGEERVKIGFNWISGPMTGASSWSTYDPDTVKQVYHIDY